MSNESRVKSGNTKRKERKEAPFIGRVGPARPVAITLQVPIL